MHHPDREITGKRSFLPETLCDFCVLCKMGRNKTWPSEFSFGDPGMVTPGQVEAENHPGNSSLCCSKGSSTTFRWGSGGEGGSKREGGKGWAQKTGCEGSLWR